MTMCWAAFCTALMVSAPNTNTSIAPTKSPTRTAGFVTERSIWAPFIALSATST